MKVTYIFPLEKVKVLEGRQASGRPSRWMSCVKHLIELFVGGHRNFFDDCSKENLELQNIVKAYFQ